MRRTLLAVAVAVSLAASGCGDQAAPSRRAAPTTTTTTTTTVARRTTTTTTTTSTTTTTVAPTPTTTPRTTVPVTAAATVVRRGDTSRPLVALTFDAGSDVGYAAAILDLLATEHIPATFGMTGAWAKTNPALVRRMAAEGHQLLNHSYDHPSFTGRSTSRPPLTTAQRLDQLARADAAIVAASGRTTVPWFRPPYGDEDASVRADVARAGYRFEVMWTLDSLGWRGVPAAEVVRRCLDGAGPGVIYLFHVGSASTDHDALPAIVAGLRQRGLGFATVAGLLAG